MDTDLTLFPADQATGGTRRPWPMDLPVPMGDTADAPVDRTARPAATEPTLFDLDPR